MLRGRGRGRGAARVSSKRAKGRVKPAGPKRAQKRGWPKGLTNSKVKLEQGGQSSPSSAPCCVLRCLHRLRWRRSARGGRPVRCSATETAGAKATAARGPQNNPSDRVQQVPAGPQPRSRPARPMQLATRPRTTRGALPEAAVREARSRSSHMADGRWPAVRIQIQTQHRRWQHRAQAARACYTIIVRVAGGGTPSRSSSPPRTTKATQSGGGVVAQVLTTTPSSSSVSTRAGCATSCLRSSSPSIRSLSASTSGRTTWATERPSSSTFSFVCPMAAAGQLGGGGGAWNASGCKLMVVRVRVRERVVLVVVSWLVGGTGGCG